MENQHTPLWDRSSSDHRPLRRPNIITVNSRIETPMRESIQNQPVQGNSDSSLDPYDILKKSTLSVNAKEFVPLTHTLRAPEIVNKTSAQSRIERYHENDRPVEQVVTNYPQEQINYYNERLYSIIQTLTYDPGQFDDLSQTFLDVYLEFTEEVEGSLTAVEIVFEMALTEPNFHYNAARLCNIVGDQHPLFSSHLHLLCEREVHNPRNIRNLTFFLAELYTHVDISNIYGKNLLDLFKVLIESRDMDNIKCICQALKLVGGCLEIYNSSAVDAIFVELENMKPLFSPSLLNLLETVVNLRQTQWGVSNSAENTCADEQNGYSSLPSDDGTIFYGPDGKELTVEEKDFLRSNYEECDGDYSDSDELYDPTGEIDEEGRRAFRDFVKLNRR